MFVAEMSIYSSVNESVEMPTPKTSPPFPFPEKMPRRLISSEHKPQPYTKSKSTKVPKLPTLNRSFSQELTPLDSSGESKKGALSNSYANEFSTSLIDSAMLSASACDVSKQNNGSKNVKRRLNMDDKATARSSSSPNEYPDLINSPRDPWCDSYKQGCGTPSTLQDQTKQFIAETLQSPTPEIDVNLIERSLNMPKRRVYDILGVLEGVGWVKKSEKNKYIWLNEVAVCMEAARKKVVALDKETNKVDEMILKAERCLTELFSDEPTTEEIAQIREHLYLTEEDFAQTEDLTKNSMIAVRANNPNLRFEVPETKEGYELIIKSEGAPIEAYTLSPDGSFTSIADSTYNTYGNLSTNPYSHNFDPFFQEFLRTSDNDYESSDYPYSQFSNSFDDIYTPNNFSLSELFDFGPARISETHV